MKMVYELLNLSLNSNTVFKMFEWSNQKLETQNCLTYKTNQKEKFINSPEIEISFMICLIKKNNKRREPKIFVKSGES